MVNAFNCVMDWRHVHAKLGSVVHCVMRSTRKHARMVVLWVACVAAIKAGEALIVHSVHALAIVLNVVFAMVKPALVDVIFLTLVERVKRT